MSYISFGVDNNDFSLLLGSTSNITSGTSYDPVVLQGLISIALSNNEKTQEPPQNTLYCHTKFTGEIQLLKWWLALNMTFYGISYILSSPQEQQEVAIQSSKTSLVVQWLGGLLPPQWDCRIRSYPTATGKPGAEVCSNKRSYHKEKPVYCTIWVASTHHN